MLLKSSDTAYKVDSVLPLLRDIADKRQEHFIVLTFDASMTLINKHLVFLGTVSATLCHPREVFAVAIQDRASSIVISHNHPSGDPMPSGEDTTTTRQLVTAGLLLGMPVIDHIIMARSRHYSYRQHRLLE